MEKMIIMNVYYQDTKSVFKGMTIQVADTSTWGCCTPHPPNISALCFFYKLEQQLFRSGFIKPLSSMYSSNLALLITATLLGYGEDSSYILKAF